MNRLLTWMHEGKRLAIDAQVQGKNFEDKGNFGSAIQAYFYGFACTENFWKICFLGDNFEVCSRTVDFKKFNCEQPKLWQGEVLNKKSIIVVSSMSDMDIISFIRHIKSLSMVAKKVYCTVNENICSFLQRCLPEVTFVVTGQDLSREKIDFYMPLHKVPFSMHYYSLCDLLSFYEKPLIFPCKKEQKKVEKILQQGHWANYKVGLVWHADDGYVNAENCSVSLAALAPLAVFQNINLYSLQYGKAGEDIFKYLTPVNPIIDAAGSLRTYEELVAFISQLDLIIAVDGTIVAHLAGAMGKPVLLLLPAVADCRWIKGVSRKDSDSFLSLWYESVEIFAMNAKDNGCWDEVIHKVITRVFSKNSLFNARIN